MFILCLYKQKFSHYSEMLFIFLLSMLLYSFINDEYNVIINIVLLSHLIVIKKVLMC